MEILNYIFTSKSSLDSWATIKSILSYTQTQSISTKISNPGLNKTPVDAEPTNPIVLGALFILHL